jgi:hypothetical protein
MVGMIAGGGRIDKPLLKAGVAYHKYKVIKMKYNLICCRISFLTLFIFFDRPREIDGQLLEVLL